MSALPPAYPLSWPEDVERAERPSGSAFKTSLSTALSNVKKSLELFGRDTGINVAEVVLSSNVGGLDLKRPTDCGVAAWFLWDGEVRCIAVDRYDKPECNLQAIHHILEARRTEMRHGGLNIVRQTFRAFAALPAPPGSKPKRHWSSVLGVPRSASLDDIERAYREKAVSVHPDKPTGSAEKMSELNAARDEARKART